MVSSDRWIGRVCLQDGCRRRLLRSWLIAGSLLIIAPNPAQTAMYQCVDRSGSTVFTDSPAQLDRCAVWAAKNPPLSEGPSTPGRARSGDVSVPTEIVAARAEMAPTHAIVPIQRAGQLLVVQAYLNGRHSARLILDTGASHTILSHDLVKELGVVMDPANSLVTLNTAGGPVQAEMIKLGAIRIGEAEVQNLQVAVHDLPEPLPGVDGLLGLTFLNQFLVTLDIQKNELHLKRY